MIITDADRLEAADYSEATHKLSCKHCIGTRCSTYSMRCIVLRETDNDIIKVIVFGDRNWRNKEHVKRIRYVHKSRISVLTQNKKP